MFLMTDESLTSLGKKVPDIMDYTSANSIVDFAKDLNEQLYKAVGLTQEEINYVEGRIKGMDMSRSLNDDNDDDGDDENADD
jgi:hypothetical protein